MEWSNILFGGLDKTKVKFNVLSQIISNFLTFEVSDLYYLIFGFGPSAMDIANNIWDTTDENGMEYMLWGE